MWLFFNAFEEFLIIQEMFYDVMRNEKDECKVLYIISIMLFRSKHMQKELWRKIH